MNVPMLLLGIAIGAAAGGLIVWLVSLTRVARDTFAWLSAEALRQNNQSFLALAQTKLGEFQLSASSDLEKRQKAVDDLVRPIHDALVRVDGKLHEVEKERIASYSGLLEQVKSMAQTQQALQAETGNLVKALRAPQVRGRWGEIQLRRVVEMVFRDLGVAGEELPQAQTVQLGLRRLNAPELAGCHPERSEGSQASRV